MRSIFSILFITFISFSIHAQSQVELLIEDARRFNAAFLKGDLDKYIDMTIPSVIEIAGGKEVMVANAKASFEMTTKSGLTFESIEPLKPSKFMFADKDLQSILPQIIITKVGETKISQKVYFLASSSDEGKTWTFLNLEPYDTVSIKTYVPSYTGDIEIPTADQPEVIKNK
ncbi:MAG: hypothetical protein ACI9P5_001837 [Saprospiraceae bacterium]|jgi:hypothetical protein|tara:strand:+ start:395 stop:910 length:516 start_codon:yes stop_codon:yes gene_type:complete